jgi:hypothetical protein
VCGAQEMALDMEALEQAMQEHMHQAHNLNVPLQLVDKDIRDTDSENPLDYKDNPGKGVGVGPTLTGLDFGGGKASGD